MEPTRFTEAWLLFTVLYVMAIVAFMYKRNRVPETKPQDKYCARMIWIILISAMIVRFIVALKVPGHRSDLKWFSLWSKRIFETSPSNFYNRNELYCDYPPGYIVILWPIEFLRRTLNIERDTQAHKILLKTLPMLTDTAGAWIVWRKAKENMCPRAALALAAFYAFNPAAISNSAGWGQIDALLTLLIVLCAIKAVEGKYIRSLIWFTAALLVKPQALLFGPLGLTFMILGIFAVPDKETRKKRLTGLLKGAGTSILIIYIVSLIFCPERPESLTGVIIMPLQWFVNLCFGTMNSYKYMNLNTLNLWYIFGLNWKKVDEYQTAYTISWILFGMAYGYTTLLAIKSMKKPHRIMLLGGTLMMLITTFAPMMHERYVFPALLLITLAFAFENDKRVFISAVALTATTLMNHILVVQGGMGEAKMADLQKFENWLNIPLCVIVVLNTLFISWTAFDICVRNRVMPFKTPAPEETPAGLISLNAPANYKLNLRKFDYIFMTIVTLLYATVAFTNLGDHVAPQTNWTSTVPGETITFDLGETKKHIMIYRNGICNTSFAVQLSNDNKHWSPLYEANADYSIIMRWVYLIPLPDNEIPIYEDETDQTQNIPEWVTLENDSSKDRPMQTARYVRIISNEDTLMLTEVGFLDENFKPLPVSITEDTVTDAAKALIDEQDLVPSSPSYMNSTYFDECYHVRTAYEHLKGMETYEWTHPPLGKLAIMLGMMIFGVNPFGWRFMGTFTGVLMLPVMYLMILQLTKSRKGSAIGTLLLALDSMHFTHTRIATVDSYAVFWIMVSYLFMFRYIQMNWNREPLKKTFVPLGLCGIAMGLACTCKWIGIYAAAGLVVLFFWTIAKRINERKFLGKNNKTVKNILCTFGFCIGFFIVIPAIIYYFSYYLQLKGDGFLQNFAQMFRKETLNRIIEIQNGMFRYHSELKSSHTFQSSWFQWPIVWTPIWYHNGTRYVPEGYTQSISCMGNPAVWWFGTLAMIFIFIRSCFSRRTETAHTVVIIGFAAQYLPWILVSRYTFIYHFFASVPFIIIASTLALELIEKKSKKAATITSTLLLFASGTLFAMFYPVESGTPCTLSYAQNLKWFKWYNFRP